jgi:hypothetical protein
MAPALQTLTFTAPSADPSLSLCKTFKPPSRAYLEHLLKHLKCLYEGAMTEFRLAYHGSLMTRAMERTFVNAAPSLEQSSLIVHMTQAHVEAMEAAASMACDILVQMRQCLLHVHGLTGHLAVQDQLVVSPYCGVQVFGHQLSSYPLYLQQQALQAQMLQGNKKGSRPSGGAPSGASLNRVSQLDPPVPKRAKTGQGKPFQGNTKCPKGKGTGRGQSKQPKRPQ